MEKPFNEMTRGEQYLRLLRIEYEDQLRFASYFRANILYSLRTYPHTPEELQEKMKEVSALEIDMKRAREFLGGAENDEIVTEPQSSETPTTDKFTEITCTTV